MDQEKLLGQAVVTVPIIHVTTCAIYLAGYSAGFGAHVGTLFGVGDLFGLSVTELFWTYLAGVMIPLVVLSPQLSPDYKSAQTKAQETGNPEIIRRIAWQDKIFVRMSFGLIAFMTVFYCFDLYISLQTDQRIPYMELSQPLAFVISFGWSAYATKLPTKRSANLLIAVVMTLAAMSFATGLSRGQGERRYPFKSFVDARPHCGGWVILRTVGDRMIALNRNDVRAVVTKECKVGLIMPRRAPFKSASLAQLTKEWWTGSPPPSITKLKSQPNKLARDQGKTLDVSAQQNLTNGQHRKQNDPKHQ